MSTIREEIDKLKEEVINGSCSVEEIQRKVSFLLYSDSEEKNVDQVVNKFDNELELIIYTLREERKVDAALKVLDGVATYFESESR